MFKYLEENTREKLCDFGLEKNFTKKETKPQTIKEKNKFEYIKMKMF